MVMSWGEILIPRRRWGKRVSDRSGRTLSKFSRTPTIISNQCVWPREAWRLVKAPFSFPSTLPAPFPNPLKLLPRVKRRHQN